MNLCDRLVQWRINGRVGKFVMEYMEEMLQWSTLARVVLDV